MSRRPGCCARCWRNDRGSGPDSVQQRCWGAMCGEKSRWGPEPCGVGTSCGLPGWQSARRTECPFSGSLRDHHPVRHVYTEPAPGQTPRCVARHCTSCWNSYRSPPARDACTDTLPDRYPHSSCPSGAPLSTARRLRQSGKCRSIRAANWSRRCPFPALTGAAAWRTGPVAV